MCQQEKWQAIYIGLKILQQIAFLREVAVLSNLRETVEIVALSLENEQGKLCLPAILNIGLTE